MQKYETLQAIRASKIVAVVRASSKEEAQGVVDAIFAGGIDCIEVTFGTPGILDIIEQAAATYGNAIHIGAGTVLDPESARAAILAGAQYLITPSLNLDVVKMAHRYGIPVMPGVYTATELVTALEAGVDVVKLFPATSFTPGIIKALRAPFANAQIIPTGGISLDNAKDWLDAGAYALGVGGSLTSGYVPGQGDKLTEVARAYRALIDTQSAT